MKRRVPSSPRGFTLLELMVASSLSLIVLAAALWSAAELQRRGTFEESLMEAQNTLRAVRELLVVELQRAGMGVGSARMVFGRTGTMIDQRYAITVSPEERFDGSGLFAKDDKFQPPPADYGTRISDALQVWSWDSEAVDAFGTPIGMVPLTLCTHAPNASDLYRSGNELCANAAPAAIKNRLVMVVRPEMRTSCIMRVTSVAQDTASPYARITVSPGLIEGQTALTGPCMATAAGLPPDDRVFWGNDKTGGFILLMRGSAFRVNWTSKVPVLERQDLSSDTTAPPANWVALSQDVEMIRLRLGVMTSLIDPTSPVLWFPDEHATPPRPALESCTNATCGPLVPGGWATPTPEQPSARDALMNNMRMVQVQVITRTARLDSSLIQRNGGGFLVDEDGHPRDGYKRRSSTLEIMPRNFAYAGVKVKR
jgi:prepilin-type N-terminal cleavage/methylation domain-containing protein